MNHKKAEHLRLFGLVATIILLISATFPAFAHDLAESPDGMVIDNDIHGWDGEGDVWIINQPVTLSGVQLPLDASIEIGPNGHLELIDTSMVLLIDGYNPRNIIINGGRLTLRNSEITTSLRGEGTVLRPFLKTNISAFNGAIELLDGSSFKFPGWVYLEGSTLTLKNSSFEPLDEVPNYDFTWGASEPRVGEHDNNDCPRLIANMGSHVLLEDSEIRGYYRNDHLSSMQWYPGDYIGPIPPVLEPGDSMTINLWELDNPQFPSLAQGYPYINPFDRISALVMEVRYRTGAEYTAEDSILYHTPDGPQEAISITNTDGDPLIDEINIFEPALSKINGDYTFDLTVSLSNSMPIGTENASISIELITLHSAFDNDIHLWDSTMTVINSVIDIDFNPSDVNPRPGSGRVITDKTSWMANADLSHRVIRVLGGSTLRTYGLELPEGVLPRPDGDPIVVTDDESIVNMYRWVEVTAVDTAGNVLKGAEIMPNNMRGTYNDPVHNPEVWDYMERVYETIYEPGTGYITLSNGRTVMFLLSDNITHPENWPNSKFVGGTYILDGTYENEEFEIDEIEASRDLSLKSFPNLVDNLISTELEFDMELPGQAHMRVREIIFDPDSVVEDGDEVFVSARIDNIGEADVENVKVEFYFDEQVPANQLGTMFVDIKGQGEEEVVTEPLEWFYPSPGTYLIIVVVDPDGEIHQQTTDDNVLTREIMILERADIRITSFQLDPAIIHEGETLTMSVDIENVGEYESTSTYANFYVDGSLVGEQPVPPLSGGENITVVQTWMAQMSSDDLSETRTMVVEVNEQQQTRDLTIGKPPILSVESITLSEDLPQMGANLDITAQIYNEGASAYVRVRFYADDVEIPGTSQMVTIPAQGEGTAEVTAEWTPAARGNREIRVEVLVDDVLEVHRTVTKPIFSEGYTFDHIVTNIQSRGIFNPNGFVVVEEGGELTINGNMRMVQERHNQYGIIVRGTLVFDGIRAYSDYRMNIIIEDEGTLEVRNDCIVDMEVSIHAVDDSTLTVSESTVRSPLHVTSELFEVSGSDFTSTDIYINPTVMNGVDSTFVGHLNDFEHTEASLLAVATPSIVISGDGSIEVSRWVRVETRSHGDVLLGDVDVTLVSSYDPHDESQSGTTANGIVYLSVLSDIVNRHGPTFVGNYELLAVYDVDEVVHEITMDVAVPNYPSDVYVYTIPVVFEDVYTPDLAVFDDDVEVAPGDLMVGETAVISADISNVGMVDVSEATVRFYILDGGNYHLIGTTTLAVSQDAVRTASISWDATLSRDTLKEEVRHIRVFVDPETDPPRDHNIDNNEAFTEVIVRAPPQPELYSPEIELQINGEDIQDDSVVERDDLEISVRIENNGGTALSDAEVLFYHDDRDIGSTTIDIPVGEMVTASRTWSVDTTGTITITVELVNEYGNISISREITVEPMELRFIDDTIYYNRDDLKINEVIDVFGEIFRVRDGVPTPIQGITIRAFLVDADGNPRVEAEATSGSDGSFYIELDTPDRGGDYTLRLLTEPARGAEYNSLSSFEVIDPSTGIPLWMIALIIVAVVAASLVGIILYLKYKGEGEWVECGECGATIPAESKNCPKCGTVFEMDTVKCSECGEWISGDIPKCPHCDAVFITTGKEVEDYTESMKKQYKRYVQKHKRLARRELGDKFTEKQFMAWWKHQPSYLTFDDWLEREETRRKKGGIECPQCGALNSIDEEICQKCSTNLITFAPRKKQEEEKKEDALILDLNDIEKMGMEEASEPEEETEEPTQKGVAKKVKKEPKRVSKMVKKKVVKKPGFDEE